jgi:hypothetical protein
LILFL